MNKQKIQQLKPFLNWAVGKSCFVKNLKDFLPNDGFNDYHEPFLGRGSVFQTIDENKKTFLSDLNSDLIRTYETFKRKSKGIIQALRKYTNTKEFYYRIRKKEFNDEIELTNKFIFLNQTFIKGIHRVNLKELYYVPFGYRKKDFLNQYKLRLVRKNLIKTAIRNGDFTEAINEINEGDLYYLDLPYNVSNNYNGVIKYNPKLPSIENQHRLTEFLDCLKDKNKGAYNFLTNTAYKND